MQRATFIEYVSKCQAALRLDAWEIHVVFRALTDADAEVTMPSEWVCELAIDPATLKRSDEYVQRVIAHELMHVLHCRLDDATSDSEYHKELERLCERMEPILIQIFPKVDT